MNDAYVDIDRVYRKLQRLREDLVTLAEEDTERVIAYTRMVDARLAQIAQLLEPGLLRGKGGRNG